MQKQGVDDMCLGFHLFLKQNKTKNYHNYTQPGKGFLPNRVEEAISNLAQSLGPICLSFFKQCEIIVFLQKMGIIIAHFISFYV